MRNVKPRTAKTFRRTLPEESAIVAFRGYSSWPQPPFQPSQPEVGGKGEHCCGNRTRQNQFIVHHGQSAKNKLS